MEAETTDLHPVPGVVVERDMAVVLRVGTRWLANVLRPNADGNLNLGTSQQDHVLLSPGDLEEKPRPLTKWKAANPEWWVLPPVVPNVVL